MFFVFFCKKKIKPELLQGKTKNSTIPTAKFYINVITSIDNLYVLFLFDFHLSVNCISG